MSANMVHETYLTSLLDNVRSQRYPSHAMLDRVEAALASREDAEAYLSVLLERTRVKYPSMAMLDRTARMVCLLTLADELVESEQQHTNEPS